MTSNDKMLTWIVMGGILGTLVFFSMYMEQRKDVINNKIIAYGTRLYECKELEIKR